MKSNNNLALRLNCEQLEARDNPSGNVVVTVANGTIYLNGDDFDNRVNVQQDGFGDVYVTGLDGTTVNGVGALYLGRGIPSNIQAYMGGGNDRTEIVGMRVAGEVDIAAGAGNDSTIVFNSAVGGSIRMYGMEGNDESILTYVTTSAVLLDGGSGIDGFHIDNTITNHGVFLVDQEFQF